MRPSIGPSIIPVRARGGPRLCRYPKVGVVTNSDAVTVWLVRIELRLPLGAMNQFSAGRHIILLNFVDRILELVNMIRNSQPPEPRPGG